MVGVGWGFCSGEREGVLLEGVNVLVSPLLATHKEKERRFLVWQVLVPKSVLKLAVPFPNVYKGSCPVYSDILAVKQLGKDRRAFTNSFQANYKDLKVTRSHVFLETQKQYGLYPYAQRHVETVSTDVLSRVSSVE